MTKTVSLQRSWNMHLETYEAFGVNEEQMHTFYGYLIFIFGIWLLGWILLISLAFFRLYLLNKVATKALGDEGLKLSKQPYMFWHKHKYLKWYWKTKFNWFCIALLIALCTVSFGNWWGLFMNR